MIVNRREPTTNSKLVANFRIETSLVPQVATAVTLGPCPCPWRGVVTALPKHCYFPFKGLRAPKIWPWNREGGGRTRTGTRDVESSRQDGRVQQGRGDHENTLPLGERVEEQVRLYGERGKGGEGGGQTERRAPQETKR